MASIDNTAPAGSKRKRLSNPRIDMTPMVDLGFLLITFFIFTTSMTDNKALQLFMPNAEDNPTVSPETRTLSLLVDSAGAALYRGRWEVAERSGAVQRTSLNGYTGAGAGINALQQDLRRRGLHDSDLVLLIKPGPCASYRQLVDALDLALIYGVKRYAVVEPDARETAYLTSIHKF